jgi:DNA-binding transcriptional LysR family regulator
MKTNINWDKFKLFYYVAKAGSVTAAAERLHVSQSALSRSILGLEDQLKMQLFERLPRGLILTKQGESLFKAAEKAFEEFTRAEISMLEKEEEPEGVLKVATTRAIANVWLIYHISAFLSNYPKIRLNIIGNDEELDLKTRQADVSIRPFIEDQPHLVQDYLCTFHLKLYASKDYLKTYGTPKTPQDLDQHKLIVFGDDDIHPYNDINWPLKIGLPAGKKRDPYLCINTSAGMRQAAEAGHGIIALAAEYPGLDNSILVEVLPEVGKPNIPIYYVYPQHLSNSKRIRIFGEYLKKRLNDQ